MKKFLEARGIYYLACGFDWNWRHWHWLYSTDWYDGQHHSVRIGPFYIYWMT